MRIAIKRRLDRCDVVGGMSMPAADWVVLRGDAWELRRVYAMAHWVSLRDPERKGIGVVEAAQEASGGVMMGVKAKPLTARTLMQWLGDYVKAGGRIKPSQCGHHTSTESFLDNPDIRNDALVWLRKNVQARAAGIPLPSHPTPLLLPGALLVRYAGNPQPTHP